MRRWSIFERISNGAFSKISNSAPSISHLSKEQRSMSVPQLGVLSGQITENQKADSYPIAGKWLLLKNTFLCRDDASRCGQDVTARITALTFAPTATIACRRSIRQTVCGLCKTRTSCRSPLLPSKRVPTPFWCPRRNINHA